MRNKVHNQFLEWIKSIAIAIVITIAIQIVAIPTYVTGESMYPTLEDNDFLLVYKLAYINDIPNRGDIIVFNTNLIDTKTNKKKDLIKRVIALPGEKITIKENKVFINGAYLNENYLSDIDTSGNIDVTVPDGHVFVLGDNRGNSADSRDSHIGTISIDDIIGKALIRMFPFNKISYLNK